MRRISVLVADDHQVFADALQAFLSDAEDIGPVWVAYSAAEALRRVQHAPVDVAVVDYALGDATGADVATRLGEIAPHTPVIVLSGIDALDAVVDALVAGVRGWLPKMVDTDHLLRAIRGVHAGEMWLDRALLGAAMPELLNRLLRPPPDPLDVLTEREREVLDCMVDGLNRNQIATLLHVSGNTVRTHTQNVIKKLGVHSSLEAVTLALRTGHYSSVGARR